MPGLSLVPLWAPPPPAALCHSSEHMETRSHKPGSVNRVTSGKFLNFPSVSFPLYETRPRSLFHVLNKAIFTSLPAQQRALCVPTTPAARAHSVPCGREQPRRPGHHENTASPTVAGRTGGRLGREPGSSPRAPHPHPAPERFFAQWKIGPGSLPLREAETQTLASSGKACPDGPGGIPAERAPRPAVAAPTPAPRLSAGRRVSRQGHSPAGDTGLPLSPLKVNTRRLKCSEPYSSVNNTSLCPALAGGWGLGVGG